MAGMWVSWTMTFLPAPMFGNDCENLCCTFFFSWRMSFLFLSRFPFFFFKFYLGLLSRSLFPNDLLITNFDWLEWNVKWNTANDKVTWALTWKPKWKGIPECLKSISMSYVQDISCRSAISFGKKSFLFNLFIFMFRLISFNWLLFNWTYKDGSYRSAFFLAAKRR